eukprot:12279800-Alexandrium_andersonii.AAC.1
MARRFSAAQHRGLTARVKTGSCAFRDNWPGCVSGVDVCAVSARSVVLCADAAVSYTHLRAHETSAHL